MTRAHVQKSEHFEMTTFDLGHYLNSLERLHLVSFKSIVMPDSVAFHNLVILENRPS